MPLAYLGVNLIFSLQSIAKNRVNLSIVIFYWDFFKSETAYENC